MYPAKNDQFEQACKARRMKSSRSKGLLTLVDVGDIRAQATHRSPSLPQLSQSERKVIVQIEQLDKFDAKKLELLNYGAEIFSKNIGYLLQYHSRFTQFDDQLEGIINSLLEHGSKILIVPLGERGLHFEGRSSHINLEVVLNFLDFANKQNYLESGKWLGMALTIYFLHEINHSSQGISRYEDVQALKAVHPTSGRRLLVELDLRSDYLSARVLSVLETFSSNSSYNDRVYNHHFYVVWCQVCRGMLEAFSNEQNSGKRKIRRIFGYLLMCDQVKNSQHRGSLPFHLRGELLPDWSDDYTRLSIQSNQKPCISGIKVNPKIMSKICRLISQRKYDEAEGNIRNLFNGTSLTSFY